jgi:peptidoglycan/LPS O-acetylase OafA/YrhL
LGKYSYGLYVYHYTLHALLDYRIRVWTGSHFHSKILPILISGTITLILSMVVAWLSFRLFESPILRLKDRFAAHGGRPKLRREVEAANTV